MLPIILAIFLFSSAPTLSLDDFKGRIPDNEPSVAARTYTCLTFESTDSDGVFTCHVEAVFMGNESWIRVKTQAVLSHEITHYRIAIIQAYLCNHALSKYQNKNVPSLAPIMKIYEHYQRQIDLLNEQFDRDSRHGLNAEVEARYEHLISNQLKQIQ